MTRMTIWERLATLENIVDTLKTRSFLNYSKGTYLPEYLGNTTAGVTMYSTQQGYYTRIGRVVFFNGIVVWTAATGTGQATLSLPFTASAATNNRVSIAVRTSTVTFANGSVQTRIAPGDSRVFFDSPLTNAASTDILVEAAGNIVFAGWFIV